MNGIDISNWQAGINISAVKPDFVVAKICEGSTFKDNSFNRFYADCKALNVPIGAYVYSHSTDAEGGRAEAEYALKLLKGRQLELPIFLDIEAKILNEGTSALMASALAFAKTVKNAGYKPGVYASAYPFMTVLDVNELKANGISIWCAAYNGGNAPPMDCDFWQYTNTGRLTGYAGDLDLDVMYGEPDSAPPKTEEAKLYPADMSVLCRGFYGSQVVLLQSALRDRGYLNIVNGVFDEPTEKAVKAFQRDNGLVDDGIAGAKTFSIFKSN